MQSTFSMEGARAQLTASKASQMLFFSAGILTVFGGILFIASCYAAAQFNRSSFQQTTMQNVAGTGIVAGLMCFVASCCACFALRKRDRRFLICTTLICVILLMIEIAAAAGMSAYSRQLKVTDPSALMGSYTLLQDVLINHLVMSTYLKCCSGCPSPPLGCNNTMDYWDNSTNANCAQGGCIFPQACQGPQDTNCFAFPPAIYATKTNYVPLVPPLQISPSVCYELSVSQLKRNFVVGPISTGACGGGNPLVFQSQFADFIGTTVQGVAVVYIFVAVIQTMMLFATCYIVCKPKNAESGGDGFDVPTTVDVEETPNNNATTQEGDEVQDLTEANGHDGKQLTVV